MREQETLGVKFNFIKYKSFKTIDKVFIFLIALGIILLFVFMYLMNHSKLIDKESFFLIGMGCVGLSFFSSISYLGYKTSFAKNFILLSDSVEFKNRSIVISVDSSVKLFKLNEIENIEIIYNSIDDHFSPTVFDLPRKQGDKNFLKFDSSGQKYCYEFYISTKKQTLFLKKILLNWEKQKVKFNIKKHK